MLTAVRSSRFIKEAKLAHRRGLDLAKLSDAIALLCAEARGFLTASATMDSPATGTGIWIAT